MTRAKTLADSKLTEAVKLADSLQNQETTLARLNTQLGEARGTLADLRSKFAQAKVDLRGKESTADSTMLSYLKLKAEYEKALGKSIGTEANLGKAKDLIAKGSDVVAVVDKTGAITDVLDPASLKPAPGQPVGVFSDGGGKLYSVNKDGSLSEFPKPVPVVSTGGAGSNAAKELISRGIASPDSTTPVAVKPASPTSSHLEVAKYAQVSLASSTTRRVNLTTSQALSSTQTTLPKTGEAELVTLGVGLLLSSLGIAGAIRPRRQQHHQQVIA